MISENSLSADLLRISATLSGTLIDTGTGAGEGAYVVVHPGTSAPARTWPAERHRQAVRELAEDGHRVVVTGKERELTAYVAHDAAVDLGGRTTLSQLAALIERAGVLVAGNTGPRTWQPRSVRLP